MTPSINFNYTDTIQCFVQNLYIEAAAKNRTVSYFPFKQIHLKSVKLFIALQDTLC